MELININFKEFREDVYQKYIEIFPEEERKTLETIERNYNKNITRFIKIDEENSRFVNILSDQVEHLYDVEFMYERVMKYYPSNDFPTREGFRMSLETVTPYLLTKMLRQPSLSLVDSVILNILNQLFHFSYRIRYSQTSDEKLLQKFLESKD